MYDEVENEKANIWSVDTAHHQIINSIAKLDCNARARLLPSKISSFFSLNTNKMNELCLEQVSMDVEVLDSEIHEPDSINI